MKPFPAAVPLELVAMDLFGLLKKSVRVNTFNLVITDRFTKMTTYIPLQNTIAFTIAAAFLEYWVYAYGAPPPFPNRKWKTVSRHDFDFVCWVLGCKHYLTTAYYPHTNEQTERFNKTIVQRLRHYMAGDRADWNQYLRPLAYSYNMQAHRTTRTTLFDLVLTCHLPSTTVLVTLD